MGLKDIIKKASGLIYEDVGDTLSSNTAGLSPDLLNTLQGTNNITLDKLNEQLSSGVPAPAQSSPVNETKAPAAPLVNGDIVDFKPIYTEAMIAEAPLTAEGFLEMLAGLGDAPLQAKRTMVGTMLNTLSKANPGVNSASITNDAFSKIKVLSEYSDKIKVQVQAFISEREKAIKEAEIRIESEKKAMSSAKERLNKLVGWCESEGNKLDDVMEFFSSDSGVSKLADMPLP